MDLGAPIGTHPAGEHGAGTGLSGGHGIPNSSNTQAGSLANNERSGFNAGLGGEHASGGIPRGTPIADQYSSGAGNTPEVYSSSGGAGTGATGGHRSVGDKLENSLDHYSNERGSGGYGQSQSQGQESVSGAYSGRGTGDALTGQSNAHTTGAGVGVYGENLESSGTHHGHHHHSHEHGARDAALAGTAGGAAGLAAGSASSGAGGYGGSGQTAAPLTRGEGLAGYGQGAQPGIGGETGSGVGPGYDGQSDNYGSSGKGSGAGAGYGAAGAAGLGAGAGAGYGASGGSGKGNGASTEGIPTSKDDLKGSGTGASREDALGSHVKGNPLSNPKDLDTGGPHSLVYQESTGQYVHRRDL